MKIAIVTGASSGMGKQFALKLDELGLDEIWGIGLEEGLLAETASEMKTKFRPFAVDLTKDGADILREALEENNPDVRWLVCASGFGKFGRYDEIPLNHTLNMIRLNCEALVNVTQTCLQYMSEGSKIAEFSSVAAFQPTPYQNVYAATKAFVYSYARALNQELKSRKILVCAVCPYWTKTAFFDRAEFQKKNVVIKHVVMYNPKDVVKKAFADMNKGKDVSVYGFIARSQVRMTKLLPAKLVMKVWIKQQKFDERYK